MIHEFTFVLARKPGEAAVDRLYGVCNDCPVAVHVGIPRVHFHRVANSLADALRSALAEVRAARLSVKHVEIAPDAFAVSH